MGTNKVRSEVILNHNNGLIESAIQNILPRATGDLIQEGDKTFLERKPVTFLGKIILEIPELPNEFILE